MKDEFKILTSSTPYRLAEHVNKALKEGWALHGAVFPYAYYNRPMNEHETHFAQAMVRKDYLTRT